MGAGKHPGLEVYSFFYPSQLTLKRAEGILWPPPLRSQRQEHPIAVKLEGEGRKATQIQGLMGRRLVAEPGPLHPEDQELSLAPAP